ncbi:MAG: T9SS type A sorting domain-containing protein [Bacteroidota bacterium]
MKKLLLSILGLAFIAFANPSFGQSFNTTADPSDTMNVTSSQLFDFLPTINNTYTDSIQIKWHVDMAHTSMPTGWTVSTCDNHGCYAADGANHFSSYIHVGSSGQWSTTIDPTPTGAAAYGTAIVSEVLTDNLLGITNKTLVFILTKNPTGISSTTLQSDEDIIMYPNPAQNDVNVVFNESLGVKSIAVYNLIGKVLTQYKTAGNSAKLNIENIPSGIYFIRLMNAQGTVVGTRKFTHQ